MKEKNDSYDLENEDDLEIDEHEYENISTGKCTINWRRVELVKEKLALKRELQDLDSWTD